MELYQYRVDLLKVAAFQIEVEHFIVVGTILDECLNQFPMAYTERINHHDLELQKLGERYCSGELSKDNLSSFSFFSRDVYAFRTNIYPFSPIWFP